MRADLRSWRDEIAESHRKLLAMFGRLPEVVLPTDAELEQRVVAVFDSSGLDITPVPFSLESARASFLKAIDGVAPSGPKNQQFKDGVIWADCMRLLDEDDVTLVTDDRAFYRDRDRPLLGPAENLAAEARTRRKQIKLFTGLDGLLGNIREQVPIDEGAVADALFNMSAQSIQGMLEKRGLALGQRVSIVTKLFATEDPTRLAGESTVTYACQAAAGSLVARGVLEQSATFEYDVRSTQLLSIRQAYERLESVDDAGESRSERAVYASGHGVIGHRTVVHVVRAPLPMGPPRLGGAS